MEKIKLMHPSLDVIRVEGKDPEALSFAELILHDIGWLTQQGMAEYAASRISFLAKNCPKELILACANGAACLHNMNPHTSSES